MHRNPSIKAISYLPESAAWLLHVRQLTNAIWLDSGHPGSEYGRFDIISAAPVCLIETRGEVTVIQYLDGRRVESNENPFDLLGQMIPNDHPPHPTLPFIGGALGYFGYDLGRRLEKLPVIATQDICLPDMCIGIYPWAIIQDHHLKKSWLVINKEIAHGSVTAYDFSTIEHLCLAGPDASLNSAEIIRSNSFKITQFRHDLNEEKYHEAVAKIKEYISAGDCYQVNFAQRFSADASGDPLTAYLVLRDALPSPFSAFFELQGGAILSLSPERFIQVNNRQVETKPIKGTVKRGVTPDEDRTNAQWLKQSIKNIAENVMIVDLLRNDLSKHCINVKVPKLCDLQTFANVHHLVSTVTAEFTENATAIDVLRDSFPGGSITGAPKIRAMEIIEELEPTRRSLYCGSVGYISCDGKIDTSIAIRTLIYGNNKMYCWGGGGIVADSDAEQEYGESIAKVNVLLKTLEEFFN